MRQKPNQPEAGLLESSGHRATGGRPATALAAPLAKLATAIIGALSAALAAPTVAGTPLSCLLAATCTTGAGAMLATWLVVQTQAQADALPVDVDVHHLHLDHLTGVDHLDRKSTRLNSSHVSTSY